MLRSLTIALLALAGLAAALVVGNLARHTAFWFADEEVTIPAGDFTLAGTFLAPDGSPPYPAVLMLHGSGPERRGDPGTHATANALLRNGLAVLMYDKRGTGASGGSFDEALYADFIDDALAALDYLVSRADVDPSGIGLHTVSESGWFGPEIAVRDGRVAFLFTKVGCPLSWIETVAWEARNDYVADGVPASEVDRLVDLAQRRWSYVIDAAADPALASGARRDALNREIAALRASVPGAADAMNPSLPDWDAGYYRSLAADWSYDPRPWLEGLEIPQYYTYGGRDVNVPTEDCVAYLDALVARTGRDITVQVFPEAGHSLFHWTGLLQQGFVPGYLDAVGRWSAEQAAVRE